MTTRLASVDYQFSKALSMHCFCLFYLLFYIHPSVHDYVCIAGLHSGIRLLGSYYVAPTKADNAIFLVVDVVQHPGDICCVPLPFPLTYVVHPSLQPVVYTVAHLSRHCCSLMSTLLLNSAFVRVHSQLPQLTACIIKFEGSVLIVPGGVIHSVASEVGAMAYSHTPNKAALPNITARGRSAEKSLIMVDYPINTTSDLNSLFSLSL